jgi:hypothetical protein
MKRILPFFLSLCVFEGFAQTPITLTRADFPCPSAASCGLPDSVLYTNASLSGSGLNASSTGPSQNWDMSALGTTSLAYQKFLPMSATPLIFQLVFLSCDFAQPLLGNQLAGNLPLNDAFEYYNYAGAGGSGQLEIKGFGANVTIPGQPIALPLPANFTSPDILYKFPMAFGNTDSSESGFSVTLPLGTGIGDITIKRKQKRVNIVDGWGSIITPAGTFDVLRLRSSINRVDSLITGFFPLGFPSRPIELKWLGNGKRIPVLQVNGTQTGGTFNPTSITYWGQKAFPSGLTHLSSDENIQLYPNPADDFCRVEFEIDNDPEMHITITDAVGRVCAHFHFQYQQSGLHTEYLPLSQLPGGTYVLHCSNKNGLVSRKLMKR